MITIKKGFTLIELLVVIAIIAILAAILFPVFAQAREKARQTNCLSNMKNIGTAIILYIDDNHETYPQAYGAATQYEVCFWTGKIFPYVKDWKMYYCPSHYYSYDGSITAAFAGYGQPSQGNNALGGGYTENGDVLTDNRAGNVAPLKAARVKSPSNVVSVYEGSNWMMNDAAWANLGSYGCYLPGTYLANNVDRSNVLSGDALSDYNNGRHNEGINLVYCDGHAGFEKSATVFSWMNTTSKNPMRPTTW